MEQTEATVDGFWGSDVSELAKTSLLLLAGFSLYSDAVWSSIQERTVSLNCFFSFSVLALESSMCLELVPQGFCAQGGGGANFLCWIFEFQLAVCVTL